MPLPSDLYQKLRSGALFSPNAPGASQKHRIGKIGPEPEDFFVDEISSIAASGHGAYLLVQIQKRLLNTQEMKDIIAASLACPAQQIQSAGLKDRHALTRQYITIPRHYGPALESFVHPQIEVLSVRQHHRQLSRGQLWANRFEIAVDLQQCIEVHEQDLLKRDWDVFVQRGFANLFGAQRFGQEQRNIAQALELLEATSPSSAKIPRFRREIYTSSLQAAVFNDQLRLVYQNARSRLGEGHPDPMVQGIREVSQNLQLRSVYPRCSAPHLDPAWIQAAEALPRAPWAWMPGMPDSKQKNPQRLQNMNLYHQSIEHLGLDGITPQQWQKLDAKLHPRAMWAWPLAATLSTSKAPYAQQSPSEADTLGHSFPPTSRALCHFVLPPGSYATALLDQFFQSDCLQQR